MKVNIDSEFFTKKKKHIEGVHCKKRKQCGMRAFIERQYMYG